MDLLFVRLKILGQGAAGKTGGNRHRDQNDDAVFHLCLPPDGFSVVGCCCTPAMSMETPAMDDKGRIVPLSASPPFPASKHMADPVYGFLFFRKVKKDDRISHRRSIPTGLKI
jgi:hypothetical protein